MPVPRSYGKSVRISRTNGEMRLDELPPARRSSQSATKVKPPIDSFVSLCKIAEGQAKNGRLDRDLQRRLAEARDTAFRAEGQSQKKRRRIEAADAELRAVLRRAQPPSARATPQPSQRSRRIRRSTMNGGLVPGWEQRSGR